MLAPSDDLFGTDHAGPARPALLFSTGVERRCLFRRPGDDGPARRRGQHVRQLFASADAV